MEKEIKLLDVPGLAKKLKSTVGTVYGWASSGKIPKWCVIKTGSSLRFDEDMINKWLDSLRAKPIPVTP